MRRSSPSATRYAGSSSWRVVGVRKNRLLVEDAPGSTPTVPWWLGPVPSRTKEVGARVGRLRREVAARLDDPGLLPWLKEAYHLDPHAAGALIDYVREQHAVAGLVPDESLLLVESWRDELGRSNVIVHCPYGSRINRTWGVAVAVTARKRFAQSWSATATNDILLLSRKDDKTPPLHEVGAHELLEAVFREPLKDVMTAAAAGAAGFSGSFRDAAVCAFQILRAYRGKRVAPWLQNYRAEELYEAARKHPEYPVIAEVQREYISDTLDVAGLEELLGKIQKGKARLVFRDVDSPSPFAHAVLIQDLYKGPGGYQMGRDRRAHLLRLHRQVLQEVLSSEQMAELLDARAIERLEQRLLHRSETTRARSSDELAQCIRDLGDVPAEMEAVGDIVEGDPLELLRPLIEQRRVLAVRFPADEAEGPARLVAADQWRTYHDAFAVSGKRERLSVLIPITGDDAITGFEPASASKTIPTRWRRRVPQAEARAAIIERHLKCRGPVTQYEIMNRTGWPIGAVERALSDLVDCGKAAQGYYTRNKPSPQWVNKANLEEIHRLTMGYLKRELAACAPYEVVDFMTRWQHVHPDTRLGGPDGLREVIRQLQGVEVVQGVLESEVLPGRVTDYRPEMLDQLIASGEVCWRRVSTQKLRRGVLTLCFRKDMAWLASASPMRFSTEKEADCDIGDAILTVRQFFQKNGPAFFDDVLDATGLDEGPVLRAVWYLTWCGELYCDTYECVRHAGFYATLSACYDLMNRPWKILRGLETAERVIHRMKRRKLDPRLGRWSPTERLRPPKQPLPEVDVVRRWAHQLLARWGIVSRDMLEREVAAPSWAKLVREFKRLELLGKLQRGYFIESHYGEQYGLPEAVELLRDCRARRSDGRDLGCLPDEPVFALSFHDPANLYAASLHMLDESGRTLRRSASLASEVARMVLQAGQPLVLAHGQLLVRLTRKHLAACIRQLQHNYAGQEAPTSFRQWNGYPVAVHPVVGLLSEEGFRLVKDAMVWPAVAGKGTLAEAPQDTQDFLPYYEDPPPVEFGPDWVIGRSPGPVRPVLGTLCSFLQKELDRDDWSIDWQFTRYHFAFYRGRGAVRVLIRDKCVEVVVRGCIEYGTHQSRVKRRLETPGDINREFRQYFRENRERAEGAIDRYLARIGKK